MMQKSVVIKIGGSLMFTHDMELNVSVLEMFKEWYKRKKADYDLMVVTVGGGRLSREVGGMVRKHIRSASDIHSVNMELTQTNAFILKGFLGDKSIYNPDSLGDAYEFLVEGKGVMLAGGLKSGWSTDMDAAVFADIVGVKKVYKLSNIDALYTKDPNVYDDAKPISDIKWEKYRKMFNISGTDNQHTPNLHIPISVECAMFCENKDIAFWVSGGDTFNRRRKLDSIFESGTHIHN